MLNHCQLNTKGNNQWNLYHNTNSFSEEHAFQNVISREHLNHVDLSSIRLCGIHLRAISQKLLKISIPNTSSHFCSGLKLSNGNNTTTYFPKSDPWGNCEELAAYTVNPLKSRVAEAATSQFENYIREDISLICSKWLRHATHLFSDTCLCNSCMSFINEWQYIP